MSTPTSDRRPDESSQEEPSSAVPAHPARRGGRTASLGAGVLGAALLAYGLRRRSWAGAAASVAGGWLLYGTLREQVDLEGGFEVASEAVTEARESGIVVEETDVTRSITIGQPADELYDRWSDPETLARVVGPVAEVTEAGEDRLRWSVDGPLGRGLEWETKTIDERPGELLRWESVEGASITAEGSVRFRPAPGDKGTEVTLGMRFDPPGGAVGGTVLDRLGFVPETLVHEALRRFKSLVETGEIPSIERNPSARGSGDLV